MTDATCANPVSSLGLRPYDPAAPAWLRDISRFLAIRSQFVISGNINDLVLIPAGEAVLPLTLKGALDALLEVAGYQFLLCYDPFDHFEVYAPAHRLPHAIAAAKTATGLNFDGRGCAEASSRKLAEVMRRFTASSEARGALLIEHAARLGDEDSQHLFGTALKLSYAASQHPMPDGRARFNPVIWVVSEPTELPTWLTLRNERIRQQGIPRPDIDVRSRAVKVLAEGIEGWSNVSESKKAQLIQDFSRATEGFPIAGLVSTTELARDQGYRADQLLDAVRLYKLGVVDNPWSKPALQQLIRQAEGEIQKQVKGQQQAIVKTVDILKRSFTGLSGAQASANSISGRPRGTLFFAGPTGVGKTELAKAVTTLLFGDERAYIRFDMSEFASEHSEARLIGAPPGYVGHDSGGELTKAIRERPFSVILFDEIEKAHPRILDKFLQILEDGRLTDSHGETVYFSESIIIFTSNLGIYKDSVSGERVQNVDPSMDYPEVEEKVKHEISSFFKFKLSRPEILNRIGDNIVVFNFITRDIARQIFDRQISNIEARLLDGTGITIRIPDDILEQIFGIATEDLSNGGRGIGNQIETILVNPLSRALFDTGVKRGSTATVNALTGSDGVYSVALI